MADQELTSARYMPEPIHERPFEPRRRKREAAPGENTNKIITLMLCPIALVLLVGWAWTNTSNYVEEKKSAFRGRVYAAQAAVRQKREQRMTDVQQRIDESMQKSLEFSRQIQQQSVFPGR